MELIGLVHSYGHSISSVPLATKFGVFKNSRPFPGNFGAQHVTSMLCLMVSAARHVFDSHVEFYDLVIACL